MEEFDKPYKNYDELIEILVHRGLKIENEEYAKFLLQTVGYYPLINGFKKPFLIEDNPEKFEPGTTLEDLYNLYIIDSQFQELFLTNVLYIEKHFASLLGNLIGKYYGVNNFNETDENNPNPEVRSYLDAHNYRGTKRYSVLREVKRQMEICKNNPIKYYKENKNHIPPWILTQNLYFGTNIQLYSIQKSNIKTAIVQKMVPIKENENLDAKKGLFGCLAEILRQFRNTAAHFSPMYLKKVSQRNIPSKRILSFYLGKRKDFIPEVTLNHQLRRAKEKFKINKKVDCHIFRHTHVSKLAELGIPLYVIQDHVGHADDQTTKLIYLHVTKKAQQKLDSQLNKL